MYHPQIYTPNSLKSIVKITASSVNSTMAADKKITLDSTGFSHTNITISNGQLVIASGEHLFLASPMATIVPISAGTAQTEFVYQWYDITNSQFVGTQGRQIVSRAGTVDKMRAPLAACYINTAITLELRCVSKSGANVNAWNSYPGQDYIGSSWCSIYTSL